MQNLIEILVKGKANVDIAGKTHTGMTTLLRCLCASEPKGRENNLLRGFSRFEH